MSDEIATGTTNTGIGLGALEYDKYRCPSCGKNALTAHPGYGENCTLIGGIYEKLCTLPNGTLLLGHWEPEGELNYPGAVIIVGQSCDKCGEVFPRITLSNLIAHMVVHAVHGEYETPVT